MTEKQVRILETALRLFAKQGYAATSTNQVAKEANVSEGLIFRHFESKEGLLNAILDQGQDEITRMIKSLQQIEEPKEVLRQLFNIAFEMPDDQKPFWKLMYSLKWQADVYDATMSDPMRSVLIPAFRGLGYTDANAEAELVLVILDGLATTILLRKPKETEALRKSLFARYKL